MKKIELHVSLGENTTPRAFNIAEDATLLVLLAEMKAHGIEIFEVEEDISVQINGRDQIFSKTMTLLACGIRHGHRVHFHKHHHRRHHESCHTLIIVVNGTKTEVKADPQLPLSSIIPIALEQTGNIGQPVDNWELKDAKGNGLDINKKIESFHFACDTKLFLSLKAGIGG